MKKGISDTKVSRMRNIVTGNYNNRTRIQTGYTATNLIKKEGDVWEERGKTWTIKNGIKQNIRKLDNARIEVQVPVCCPDCGNSMNHSLSKYYWDVLKMCKDCAAKFHTNLKETGKWNEYTESLNTANFNYWLEEVKKEYYEWVTTSNNRYISKMKYIRVKICYLFSITFD